MDLKGEYRLPAPRDTVWAALNDLDVLQTCIPGCDTLEKLSDTELAATVSAKIGFLTARFAGTIRLENIAAPESYTLAGEGKGGLAGFAKGAADVRLTDAGDATILTYRADAEVGGRIAQLGGRLIENAARKLSERFFDKFAAHIAERAASPGETAEV